MSNLKEHIMASYGASIYKRSIDLKGMKKNMAKSKNQFIFLQRCVKYRLIPKSLRIDRVVHNKNTKSIVNKFRFELLISIKNDAKHRFFKYTRMSKEIEDELSLILSNEDMLAIKYIAEKSGESMFVRSKERFTKKFGILKHHNRNIKSFGKAGPTNTQNFRN